METEAPPREEQEREPEFGRGYWLLFGFGGGMFAAIAIAIAVLIVTTEPSTYSPGTTVPLAGGDQVTVIGTEFAFDPADLVLNPSSTLTLDNRGVVLHNIEIEGVAGFKVEAPAGQTATGTIDAAPGDYTIFCSIPGHREAGMEGTLTVVAGG